jgi:hypothetical protein
MVNASPVDETTQSLALLTSGDKGGNNKAVERSPPIWFSLPCKLADVISPGLTNEDQESVVPAPAAPPPPPHPRTPTVITVANAVNANFLNCLIIVDSKLN